jgi:tripartite motif-containing protein 71
MPRAFFVTFLVSISLPATIVSAAVNGDDPIYEYAGDWGGPGDKDGEFISISDIAVSADGTVYVCDYEEERVQCFDRDGRFLRGWSTAKGERSTFPWPLRMAVSPAGVVYISHSKENCVRAFTTTGDFLYEWGTSGTNVGEFDTPGAIAVAPDGTVYVTDDRNYRIQYFSPEGSFLGKWGIPDGPGKSPRAYGVAVSENNIVYVTSYRDGEVGYFSPEGVFLGSWYAGLKDDRFKVSSDSLAIDSDGEVFFMDDGNERIKRFTATGSFTGAWTYYDSRKGGFAGAGVLAIGPDDYVYVGEGLCRCVFFFKPTRESE